MHNRCGMKFHVNNPSRTLRADPPAGKAAAKKSVFASSNLRNRPSHFTASLFCSARTSAVTSSFDPPLQCIRIKYLPSWNFTESAAARVLCAASKAPPVPTYPQAQTSASAPLGPPPETRPEPAKPPPEPADSAPKPEPAYTAFQHSAFVPPGNPAGGTDASKLFLTHPGETDSGNSGFPGAPPSPHPAKPNAPATSSKLKVGPRRTPVNSFPLTSTAYQPSPPRNLLPLSILNDSVRETTELNFARFAAENVLERVRAIDTKARTEGLASLKPATDPLISLGMEINVDGVVTKNSYGVLDLAWQAEQHPEWPDLVAAEVVAIRERIQEVHGQKFRFIIWAGMGGSMEDKTACASMGLLKGGPQFYSLDSTDPEKLKSIIDDMQKRSGEPINKLLPATLVVGMAMGMTSYEPVVNLEKLAGMYDKFKIDSTPNFIYLTLPGSILDQFAGPRGYKCIPLQLDEDNTTAGRHSAPLTRGTLYPLAFANKGAANKDLREWIKGAFLTDAEIADAFKLASFLHAQGEAGRDKVTLLMPKSWLPVSLWTKQDVEESLGKSAQIGIKIVIGEKFNGKCYRRASDPKQDRVFLAVQRRGEPHPEGAGITALRAAKYPMAVVTFPSKGAVSHYMQFIHYVVFALGYLRKMNFVTQPSVELYKAITSEIYKEAQSTGDIHETKAWKALIGANKQAKRWFGVVSLETPESLSNAIRYSAETKKIHYGELTFFGDTRYSEDGKQMRRALENAAQRIFRVKLKMVADVYEGPAMNHSYHEMIIGHGGCFSIVLLSEKQTRFPTAGYEPTYHMAQFLATKQALEQKGRVVRAILVKDLSPDSIKVLEQFFSETAALLELQQSLVQ
jgi:glucose-6-phosphate isomerase